MKKPLAFVIEDDKNLAAAFSEALLDAGYAVEIIYDGKTALEKLAQATPATVILDLHIPHVKGSDVLAYIRGDARLKDIRVVVATADDKIAETLRGVADLILLKPVGFSQLRDLAKRVMPQS